MVAALRGMSGGEEDCPLGIQGHPWVSTCLLTFAHPDLLPSGCQWAQGDQLEWETEDKVPQILTARKGTTLSCSHHLWKAEQWPPKAPTS